MTDEMNRTIDGRAEFGDIRIDVRRESLDRFPEALIIEIERREVSPLKGSFDNLQDRDVRPYPCRSTTPPEHGRRPAMIEPCSLMPLPAPARLSSHLQSAWPARSPRHSRSCGSQQRHLVHHLDARRHRQFGSPLDLGFAQYRRSIRILLRGQQHDTLALARVRQRHRHRNRLRPERGGDGFDRRERHHLARDLGKALGAAFDGDEAGGVDRHDIAGVVPAVRRRFEHAGILRAQIADHDIGTAHRQPPALVDARNGIEPVFHQRREPADGARAIGHRRIHGQHRRGLGDAVASSTRMP